MTAVISGAVTLTWTGDDRHRTISRLAPFAGAAAAALAVFGMPPISIHGPLHFVGIMDPLCGMTRGTAAASRGALAEATRWNPASPLVPFGVLLVMARSLVGAATGRWLEVRLKVTAPFVTVAAVLVAALAVRQQLHAEMLGG